MSRIERLKEYAAMKGPAGASTQKNIDHWSERACDNSGAPRAKGKISTNGKPEPNLDPPRLPSTGEVKNRDTSLKPERNSAVDKRMVAKKDLNHVGSPFMADVRRSES